MTTPATTVRTTDSVRASPNSHEWLVSIGAFASTVRGFGAQMRIASARAPRRTSQA